MFNEHENTKMNLKIMGLMLIFIMLMMSVPDILFAAESIDEVVTKFQEVFNDQNNNQITSYLFARAKVIFYYLALIQLSWNLMRLAMEGRLEIQSVVLAATRQLLVIGIMYWFLTSAQDNFNAIIDGFNQAGKSLNGTSGKVSEVIKLGTDTVDNLFISLKKANGRWWSKLPEFIVVGICSVIILITFAFASLTFIIAQCKVYMSAMIATFFMGFGANDYTRNIAITAFKGVFCAAIELFVLHILFGLGKNVFSSFFSDVSTVDLAAIIPLACQLVIATFVYSAALKTLPQFASGILAGSPLGGGSAMGSGQALAGAVAGGVAAGLATVGAAALGGVGGVAAAKAAGAGKLATIGKVMSGMAKGAYGGQQGQMGNIMRAGAQNAILKGLQRNQNSMSAPNQNSNNVTP